MINQTIYTTRIEAADDPVDYSITLSQFVYSATKPGNRPNSVILADKDDLRLVNIMYLIYDTIHSDSLERVKL